jgi:DNA (cytosine-5)-methyltransferase 1
VDVVAGGFPCQPFSSASHGNATAVDLWPEMRRVVADVRPPWVFAENVIDRPIQRAADDLYALGYSTRYSRLDAADVGAPHRRKRWWLVAHADGDAKPSKPVHVAMARQSSIPGLAWWAEDISRTLGLDDGDADRMEQLETLGNGQVPILAAWAWRLLADGHGAHD